jgi:plastocyanin
LDGVGVGVGFFDAVGDGDREAGALAGAIMPAAEVAGALGDARLEADGDAEAFPPAEVRAVDGGTCAAV